MIHLEETFEVFNSAILDYHKEDQVEQLIQNPISDSLKSILYEKAWIDTVQWHCEDEVRHPSIQSERVRYFKNKIDTLNQQRTNLVEKLDDYFLENFQKITVQSNARLNTESLAWAIDRLSILALKIYHMNIEANRESISQELKSSHKAKLELLLEQKSDLISSLEYLIKELEEGKARFKVYRQVKMYNDADLNPVLRSIK